MPQSESAETNTGHQHSCPPATIGIETTTLSTKLRQEHRVPDKYRGAVVIQVIPGSPADVAGIVAGDVITGVGGEETTNDCDFDRQVSARACGTPLPLRIWSDRMSRDVTVTPVDAASFYETACGSGSASACYLLGLQYKGGDGHPRDEGQARSRFERACEAGSASACGHLASWSSKDAPQSAWPHLQTLSRKGCAGGYAPACVDLGFMYATGTRVERDDAASVPWFRKGCDLGDAQGCYNMGLMLQYGRGVEKDETAALAQYEAGCDQGAPNACTNAGYLRQNGIGAERWESRAVENYRLGCLGSTCTGSNTEGCLNWARCYRDGIGVNVDAQHASEILEDLCERGKRDPHDADAPQNIARACSLLGALKLEKDPTRAVELFHRGCDEEDAFGCYNLGVFFSNGQNVAQSDAAAADYFGRACGKNDGEACYWLALQVRDGTGITQDADRAKELMTKACESGFEKACR